MLRKIQSFFRFVTSCLRPRSIIKAFKTLSAGGPEAVLKKLRLRRRSYHYNRIFAYRDFQRATRLTEEELAKQRRKKFKYSPVFGIVIPLFNTKTRYLEDLIASFKNQTYSKFKIFLVDASPAKENNKTSITDTVLNLYGDDARFVYHVIGDNFGISGNTNIGINLAMSDPAVTHIGLCDHDDIVAPNAFFEYAKALNDNPNAKILYSDEDTGTDAKDSEASFIAKPDFNEFLLEACNYINHFFVCEKQLLKRVKTKDGRYERSEFDGAQDYDLYLRLTIEALKLDKKLLRREAEKIKNCLYTSSTIYHVPKFLYRWRAAEGSTAKDPANKMYAFEAGKRALEEYFKARRLPVASVEITDVLGTYRTHYTTQSQPLVSVIIPNKDHIEDLDLAIKSLRASTYSNLEFIVVENNSEEESTFAYYDKLKHSKDVQVVYYEGNFNYSAINNFGLKFAKGEYILLLNNDIEMIEKTSIAEMVAVLSREGVGAAGAQLLYSDGTIQHAGVVIGIGHSAAHVFCRHDVETTYANRARCTTNYSAVTGACLMTKKSVLAKTKGLDEKLPVAFNDIDLCLHIRSLGLAVVYTPYARFYHYESKSRGLDAASAEKRERMAREAEYLSSKWPAIYKSGDPYYNPNLTLSDADFSLRSVD